MTSHTWTETQYTRPFQRDNNLAPDDRELLFSDNPCRFLFEDGRIPNTYVGFLKLKNPTALATPPDWIEKTAAGYGVVV